MKRYQADRARVHVSQSAVTSAELELELRLTLQTDLELLENLLRLGEVHESIAAACQIDMWRAKRAKVLELMAARRTHAS